MTDPSAEHIDLSIDAILAIGVVDDHQSAVSMEESITAAGSSAAEEDPNNTSASRRRRGR